MTNLQAALTGVTRIGIDTAPFIYLIEAHIDYLPTNDRALQQVKSLHVVVFADLLSSSLSQ